MSVPALRRPKFLTNSQETKKSFILPEVQYVIVTLKDQKKLVVASDAYHGVITIGEVYKCVFCQAEMALDSYSKVTHKKSIEHLKMLDKYPHIEEYEGNLIRKISNGLSFCTICNVTIGNPHLQRHLATEVHSQEFEKAAIRATIYKPF